jgi:lipoate-protein ligase A
MDDFSQILIQFVTNTYKDVREYKLSEQDYQKIQLLIENRYSKWEWNYGYSPTYSVAKTIHINETTYEFETKVENGIIVKINITNDLIKLNGDTIVSQFIGLNHNPKVFVEKLNQLDINEYFPGLSLEKLISGLF